VRVWRGGDQDEDQGGLHGAVLSCAHGQHAQEHQARVRSPRASANRSHASPSSPGAIATEGATLPQVSHGRGCRGVITSLVTLRHPQTNPPHSSQRQPDSFARHGNTGH
jgi:hypothetical protein